MRHAFRFRSVFPRLRTLLLLALLAGLAASVAPIARAASGTVILEISQAEAINKNNDAFPLAFWAVQQDFYPKLTVGGGTVVQGPEIAQRDWALWDPVVAVSKTYADLNELNDNSIVSGTVELWDADDIDAHDQFDINADPLAPNRALRLLLDVCSLRFVRQGDTSGAQFSGPTWMPQGTESDPARVQVNIRTSDGRPFLPNNVAIADAGPVQAVYHPRYIIENKSTAFKLDLTSSHSIPVNAAIAVQMSDGFTTVSDVKSVVVPPEGLRVFFFDGSGSAPYSPRKQPNLRRLQYTVAMNVTADSNEADKSGPFPNCVPSADNSLSGSVPVIATDSPKTLYLPWDWGASAIPGESITPAPPTVAQVRTTAEANEKFRKAIFPIADVVSAVYPGRALSIKTELEPAPTILGWSVAAHIVGIDTLELMPRNNWFSENASRLRFGATAIGMSLGEFAPHAVISEQGYSEVAVHEQGHTYQLSRRTCSTGGAAELLFGLGCRDEYNHAAIDGAPYRASGFDVLGQVYPSGSGGAASTRDVNAVNFMDSTGPRDGDPYDRWIDNLSYDWLSEQLRSPQDPAVISMSGYVQVPGGLDQPTSAAVTGKLLPAFRYDGVPDLPEATLGDQQGPSEGQFYVRLVTAQGERRYRFTPQFQLENNDTGGYGFFAFAVPWDPATTAIELVGPTKASDLGNPNGTTGIPIGLNVSSAAPTITKLRAAAGKAPDLGGQQFTPPTINFGERIVVAWDQQDADTPGTDMVAMLYVIPPAPAGNLSAVATAIPLAVNLVGGQASFSAGQFASLPGDYGARVVVSDGVNTTSFEVAKLFSVRTGVYLPLTRR
ncbi:MAG TPA: hypothetical protein VFU22_26340 [Roseiflexaceae bacterium]|nr:hypothetical protein [Roseiflexaceae bacterium]